MIDLKIYDGVVVPGRLDITPISFQEASFDIDFLIRGSLYEASSDDNIFKKTKKIISTLIDKVLGFFRLLINKIRSHTLSKTPYILKNKKTILSFTDDVNMNIPKQLLSPNNNISMDWFYSKVSDMITIADTSIRTNEIPDSEQVHGSAPSIQLLSERLVTELLKGYKKHMQNVKVIFPYIYGHNESRSIGDMDKKALLDEFINTDKQVNMLNKLYDSANINLTKTMKQLGFAGYSREAAKFIDDPIMEFYVNTYGAIIHVTNLYVTILMTAYNTMYGIMEFIIKRSENK